MGHGRCSKSWFSKEERKKKRHQIALYMQKGEAPGLKTEKQGQIWDEERSVISAQLMTVRETPWCFATLAKMEARENLCRGKKWPVWAHAVAVRCWSTRVLSRSMRRFGYACHWSELMAVAVVVTRNEVEVTRMRNTTKKNRLRSETVDEKWFSTKKIHQWTLVR